VPESEIHSIAPYERAVVDTGNGTIVGSVSRIAPSANNGSVDVDVTFSSPLPSGSRPNLNVSGNIVQGVIPNALSIATPIDATANTISSIYKLIDNGTRAIRVKVRFGRATFSRIEVLSGLSTGDSVIVSDTSAYVEHDILRFY